MQQEGSGVAQLASVCLRPQASAVGQVPRVPPAGPRPRHKALQGGSGGEGVGKAQLYLFSIPALLLFEPPLLNLLSKRTLLLLASPPHFSSADWTEQLFRFPGVLCASSYPPSPRYASGQLGDNRKGSGVRGQNCWNSYTPTSLSHACAHTPHASTANLCRPFLSVFIMPLKG